MKRTNEEFSAEVFRRSEEYFYRKRAQRKKALTLCVPLCALTVIVSAIALPYAVSDHHDLPAGEQISTESNETLPNDETVNNNFEQVVNVSLKTTGAPEVFSSNEHAKRLAERLDELCADENAETSAPDSFSNETDEDRQGYIEAENFYYTITVTENEEEKVYRIIKNALLTPDGKYVYIDAEELAEIREMLNEAFSDETNEVSPDQSLFP